MESARVTVHGILVENTNSWWLLLSSWCKNTPLLGVLQKIADYRGAHGFH